MGQLGCLHVSAAPLFRVATTFVIPVADKPVLPTSSPLQPALFSSTILSHSPVVRSHYAANPR
ncbi:hypothetical protein ANAPRD1_01159 [Anaplasma phagocytophilum]|nr:hypothetical protein ANAPRD1_01159 [Anaplasma phagocytophilum]